ncbi:phosphatase PAP2 family protein [Nitrospira sp. Kam-Ns4a]
MDWDVTVFYAINGLAGRSVWADEAALALSRPGLLLWPGVLLLGYWLWTSRREALRAGPLLAALVLVGDFLGAQLKHAVGRDRPCKVLAGVRELTGCGGTFGFPSNHALNTAAAAAFLQVLYPVTGWVTWPLVALIGLSRVYVGAHFLSDVLGGWLLGSALGVGAALCLRRWPGFRTGAGRGAKG